MTVVLGEQSLTFVAVVHTYLGEVFLFGAFVYVDSYLGWLLD